MLSKLLRVLAWLLRVLGGLFRVLGGLLGGLRGLLRVLVGLLSVLGGLLCVLGGLLRMLGGLLRYLCLKDLLRSCIVFFISQSKSSYQNEYSLNTCCCIKHKDVYRSLQYLPCSPQPHE